MTKTSNGQPDDLDGLAWRKAQKCNSGSCVEFAQVDTNNVAIRDSKNLDKAPLLYTKAEWNAFIDGVKNGEFDLR